MASRIPRTIGCRHTKSKIYKFFVVSKNVSSAPKHAQKLIFDKKKKNKSLPSTSYLFICTIPKNVTSKNRCHVVRKLLCRTISFAKHRVCVCVFARRGIQ